MKLRLPQALIAAVLMATSSAFAVTFTSNKVSLASLTANQVINFNGVTYTVQAVDDNTVKLRGFYPASGTIDNLNPAITMGLNTANITSTTTADIMYTYADSTKWGLDLYNGAYRGVWGGTTDYNNGNQGRASLSGSEVTAVINNTGSYLFNGGDNTAAEANRLYSSKSLKASNEHIDDVTFNKGIVDYVYLNESTTAPSLGVEKYYVSNADGTWSRLYSTWYEPSAGTLAAPATAVEATFVTEGKTAISSNAIANINAKCGDIIVGGSGQLSQSTNVTLQRNVYIGATDYAETGDHAAASGCAIRLDAGTFANVSLIEDASIYVMYSASSTGGYITTLNLGSHTMTKQGAGNLFINGLTEPETGGALRVASGTLTLNARSISTVNSTITVADGATFAVYNQDSGNNDAAQLTVNDMVLEGNATLRIGDDNKHRARLLLGNINSTAGQDIVLTVSDAHPASGNAAGVVFKNGITGTMSGRLDVREATTSNDRQFAVFLEDEDFLKDTVVNIAEHNSGGDGYIMLMVGSNTTSEIQVKGLDSDSAIAKNYKAISYNGSVTVGVSKGTASQGGHTLLITADGEDSYTFSGDMGDTLGVKMTGTGSQTLKNIGANAVADAGAGHLTISNAVGNNTVLRVGGGQLTANGTLGTNVTLVSDGGWTLNNSSHKYEYSYDIADHVDGTNASTLLDSASYAFVATGDGENARCSTLDATNFHHATLILNSDTPAGTTAAGAYVNAGSTWGSDVQKLVMDGANLISLSGQTNTLSQNIELKSNTAFRAYGDPASGGDSRAHATMILTGELSGTGNIIQRDGGTLVLNFSDSTGWTGGLVTQKCGNNAGMLEIESSMTASSVTLNGGSVLRIGKANTEVTLNTGAFTTTEATQNIELGNGAAWNINGRMTLNNNVATTVNIGTIGTSFNGTARDGDYGSVTVTGLTMAINGNKHSTLNIGTNVALNITGEGSTNINANNDTYATAPLYLSNWQANSVTNIYGTLNALNCQYISVVVPGNNRNTVEMNVMEGGVLNMKGLILQYRQNTGTDLAYADVKLKDGSMLNIGSEGIQKYAIGGGGEQQDVCKLYIHMGEGVTIGNLNGADGWTAGYDFTNHETYNSSFNNTVINTQNYVAATDGQAGSYTPTGGTITLTGNVNGSVTKAGAGKLVVSAGTTGDDTLTATVEKGTLEIGSAATVVAGGKTTVAAGATLDVQGALTLNTGLDNSGIVTATGANATIAFANDTILTGNGDTAFGSAQVGSVTVTKRGTGQLTLTDGIGSGNTLLFEAGTLSGGMTSGMLSFASLVGQGNHSLTAIAVGDSKLTLSDVGIDLGTLDLTDEAAGTFNLLTYTDANKFELGGNMLVNGNSVDSNGWFYITDGTGAAIGKAQLIATETALQLRVDHSVEINTLVWGAQDGTWVGSSADGWQGDTAYTDGSVVIFDGTGSSEDSPLAIALSGDIAPSTIQVGGYYTFESDTTTAGHLAGIAKLTVGSLDDDSQPVETVLTLATDNAAWTGDITILDSAELIATHTNALGAAQVSIEQGGTLTLSSAEGETGIFDLTQTVSGAGALQVKDYAHVKLGNASITGLTTVSDHAHVEANVAGALGDVTLKDSAVLTLGDDAAVGGAINFSTGGTLKYGDGVTADLSGGISGDTVTVDVGSNTVTWANTPGTTLVSGSADTTGTLILDNRETQPVDELVVAGGKVKIGHAMALKNAAISNGTANINTISTNFTLQGGTLEFTNGYSSDGNGLAASVLARWTYMISGTVEADLASGQSAHITMGTEPGYNNGDGIGFANENALTYLATNNGGTLYIDADITGFGSINAVNRKFKIAKSTGAVDGVEVVINGQLGNNGSNNTDSSRIIIDKLGAGTLKIAGANYTPQLTIEEGTVIAAHAQALGKERSLANVVTVGTGDATATLDLQVGNTTAISQLLGNANGVIKSTAATAQTLKVGSATNGVQASAYHGKIESNVNLEVAANTVTLDGNLSEFNGNVKVSGGTLNLTTSEGNTINVSTLEMAQSARLNIAEGQKISTASLVNRDYVLAGLGGDGTLEYTGAGMQLGVEHALGTIIGNVHITNATWLQFSNSTGRGDNTAIAGKFVSEHEVQVCTDANLTVQETGELGVKGVLDLGHADVDGNKGTLTVAGTLKAEGGVAFYSNQSILNVQSDNVTLGNDKSKTSVTALPSGSGTAKLGTINISDGKTLHILNAEISHIDFATEDGAGRVEITAGALLKGTVEQQEGTDNLSAIMAGCSLQSTDVVIDASGAIEAKARELGVEGFFNKKFTLNIMSGVTLAAGNTFSLDLTGMEHYSDIQLHWKLADSGEPIANMLSLFSLGEADPTEINLDTNTDYHVGYTGAPIVFGSMNGQVVDVWATFTLPEPTTGALSVLGLAALAARRRRKAK